MGTVSRLPATAETVSPQAAVRAYLATISHKENAGTKHVYGGQALTRSEPRRPDWLHDLTTAVPSRHRAVGSIDCLAGRA